MSFVFVLYVRIDWLENVEFEKDSRMLDFAHTVCEFKLPRWDQIPSLGLYMDQVVTVIEKSLAPILDFSREAFITSSMVNNYVKLGIVQKPEKKKYSREHIAGLMVITILKQSIAISDIRLGIDEVIKNQERAEAYDSFCEYLERAMWIVSQSVISPCDSANIDMTGNPLIMMAACSFATKIFAAKMLSIVRDDGGSAGKE